MHARAEAYVYYRVRPGCEAAAEAALRRLGAALRADDPEWRMRWLVRDEAPGSAPAPPAASARTWMEIHSHPSGFDASRVQRLADTAAAAGLDASVLAGPRHLELFVPCAWL